MFTICFLFLYLGLILLFLNIYKFCRYFYYLKNRTYRKKLLTEWVWIATYCFFLMLFVLEYVIAACFFVRNLAMPYALYLAISYVLNTLFLNISFMLERRMLTAIESQSGDVVKSLIYAIEAKDEYTRGHSDHVSIIVKLFYHKLPQQIKQQINYSRLEEAALLHDIGKIGIADDILKKKGALTEEEWAVIKQHPVMGSQILSGTSYEAISYIIYCHHERIDGQGYYQVPCDQIPIESKIIAIADTFSALCTNRTYRSKKTYEEAVEIIKNVAGKQLDAQLVQIFLSIPKEELEEVNFCEHIFLPENKFKNYTHSLYEGKQNVS